MMSSENRFTLFGIMLKPRLENAEQFTLPHQ